MVVLKEQMYSFITPKPCNGTGHVEITCFLDPQRAYGTGRGFCICTMPEGSSCGVHGHTGECELYLILSGVAKITDNGEEYVIKAGDMCMCEDGGTHSIANVGQEDLKYISLILYSNLVPKQ